MKILAIETSCDETALAIVEAKGGPKNLRFKVLKNFVASQIKIHRPFGGVVPNLAKREHVKNLPVLLRKIFGKERIANGLLSKNHKLHAIGHMPDLVAVTVGPGLEPALWAGINFAKELRKKFMVHGSKFKVIGANHLEGHLYSFLLPQKGKSPASPKLRRGEQSANRKPVFPAIALLVSGGHTIVLKMNSLTKWEKLGETRDDAAGEAFDKVARMLGLPYPGGPEIEKLARRGNPAAINFPRPMINDESYDFSFSGLKTAVLYYLRQTADGPASASRGEAGGWRMAKNSQPAIGRKLSADVAASFQTAAIDVLVAKTMRAAREFKAKSVILCGGVAANRALRRRLGQTANGAGLKFFVPDFKYNLDNAAMIAAAGYMAHLRGKKYALRAKGDLGI